MGLFDKLKRKPKGKPAAGEKKPKVVKESQGRPVVTPEGKLVAAAGKTEPKAKKVKPKKEDTGDAYRVLIKPLISEKGSYLGQYNQYLFEVAPGTNKIEVKKAIKKVYGVETTKVNMLNVGGKHVRYGRSEGRTKNWKKAIVSVAPGQKIEIQEGL